MLSCRIFPDNHGNQIACYVAHNHAAVPIPKKKGGGGAGYVRPTWPFYQHKRCRRTCTHTPGGPAKGAPCNSCTSGGRRPEAGLKRILAHTNVNIRTCNEMPNQPAKMQAIRARAMETSSKRWPPGRAPSQARAGHKGVPSRGTRQSRLYLHLSPCLPTAGTTCCWRCQTGKNHP